MKTEPTRLDLSKVGYRLEPDDSGYVETGYYVRTEWEEDPSAPSGYYVPKCEGCGSPATWDNVPDDRTGAGYGGLAWCDDDLLPEANVGLSHFSR